MTKLFAVGALGALGAVAAVRAKRRLEMRRQQTDALDPFAEVDLDEPVVITEEVILLTEDAPFDMPGPDAPPR